MTSLNLTTEVDYMKIWDFEKQHKLIYSSIVLLEENPWVPVYVVITYLSTTYIGQLLMKNRLPYDLTRVLAAWNFMLAGFSILAFSRTFPEILNTVKQDKGIYLAVCKREYFNSATGFWALVTTLSKIAEFGDTAFIVMKKKPLTFLNWGHHSIAFLGGCYAYARIDASARLFMVMNLFVHSFMYIYFGLKTLKYSVPKTVSKFITFIQLLQMLIGTIFSAYTASILLRGITCDLNMIVIYAGCIFYPIFLYMFTALFYRSYIKEKSNIFKSDKIE